MPTKGPTMSKKSQTGPESLLFPSKNPVLAERCDSDSQIALWQAGAHIEGEEDTVGLVARLLRACVDSLAFIVRSTDPSPTSKRSRTILRRCESLLKLWANGHGAWSGKLDSLLERSKNLRHTTLSILNPLCKLLLDGTSCEAHSLGYCGWLTPLQASIGIHPQ
jgi:hypothetical protein